MLSEKSTRNGEFSFSVHPLKDDEKNLFGIFISHSSQDNERFLEPLLQQMRAHGLFPLCDTVILAGGEDYQRKIEKCMNCYAAVIIVTENSLRSFWVNYEVGNFAEHGVPVLLWDPENILMKPENAGYVHTHFGKYMPAYTGTGPLIEKLESISLYSDMYTDANSFVSPEQFHDRMKQHLQTVLVTISSRCLDGIEEELMRARIGILLVNFGMFYPDHGNGEICYAKRFGNKITDGICPVSGARCALCPIEKLEPENSECMVLNYVTHSGKLIPAGDRDMLGNVCKNASILFHFPLHKKFGSEFKFILDVDSPVDSMRIMDKLREAGMNPTFSKSNAGQNGGRIYLSLQERRDQGLFMLDHQFRNNFLCPNAFADRHH